MRVIQQPSYARDVRSSPGGLSVAYPPPTPVIRGRKDVEEFYRRLEAFTLTAEQLELYRDAIERQKRRRAADTKAPSQ
ncbi:MAG TPA: hypothetical protein VJ547_07525 [Candidatus Thermoplasmatota archaeon]|nr:hypothetical protein [Candidatus Thermoplasmatota archaeon]